MASSQSGENVMQCKTCRSGEGDTNISITKASDNPDKQTNKCPNCNVFKSGPLFISSKGLGWTSWKKRWFVLTRTSLVFFRTDPAAVPQKGGEANLTLGGIDLNNSGSVVVKADKRILTVLFPDGRDGRAFTIKAETSEDLFEWKAALENALTQAPNPALAVGQNGILHNDITESVEDSCEQLRDSQPAKSTVVGRPILLALEDIDGSPSFLEKALRFIEQHGIKVEGILRQSADVEEVKRRVREYEQGKVDFASDEDAHVVGDCIKYVLRELPSSPVPASCCTALVESYRTDHGRRVDSMRTAIYETFPEPNRHLLQRILKMMQIVASHKSQNRMSLSGLAACMAPLLLRPLLAGDCEFEDNFNMGGDGSLQLLKAAAAANHAQAIVIILLEEYDRIFNEDLLQEGSMSSELYSDSGDGDVEDDDSTDNDIPEDDEYHDEHTGDDNSTDNDIPEDDGYDDGHNGLEADIGDDSEHLSSESISESNSNVVSGPHENEFPYNQKREGASLQDSKVLDASKFLADAHDTSLQEVSNRRLSSISDISLPEDSSVQKHETLLHSTSNAIASKSSVSHESNGDIPTSTSRKLKSVRNTSPPSNQNVVDKSNEPVAGAKRSTIWGRTSARKNLSMESIDLSGEDEIAIQKLEDIKNDLQNKIDKEVKGNAVLQDSLERRIEDLHERRLVLEKDIERLREQLQKERDLRTSLESGLMNMRPGHVSFASAIDSKTRADLEEVALAEADIVTLKQKVADLRGQLKHSYVSLCESCGKHLYSRDHSAENNKLEDVRSVSLDDQHVNWLKGTGALSGVACQTNQVKEQGLPSSKRAKPQAQNREPTSQNINSSGNGALSGVAWETMEVKEKELPSSKDAKPHQVQNMEPSSQNTNSGNRTSSSTTESISKFSSKKEGALSEVACETKQEKEKELPSSKEVKPPQDQRREPTSRNTKSSGSRSSSSTKDSIPKFSSKKEDSIPKFSSKKEDSKTEPQGARSSSPSAEPLSEQLHTNQSSAEFPVLSCTSYGEDPTMTIPASISKSSTSKGENIVAADRENVVTQSQESVPPSDGQTSRKQSKYIANKSSKQTQGSNKVTSIIDPLKFGQNTSLKKFSLWGDNGKKEAQDQSLCNKQPSHKQQPTNTMMNGLKSPISASVPSSEELTVAGHNGAVKRSCPRPEETVSSSASALTKLTNRLNFLKERRAQLANEFQITQQHGHASGPDGAPSRNNSR